LALAFHSKGMIEEAIKYYREALRLKPDYVKAKENLRMALSKKRFKTPQMKLKEDPI
jgi:tetratricopeptide (TPR) repeat protein